MNAAKEARLRFIEILLIHYGQVNSNPLMEFFGIARVQASRDLREYMALNPNNMTYTYSQRKFVRTEAFVPMFDQLEEHDE